MSGYNGYSMSNNAVDAYKDGEKPLSKWTKKAILKGINEINPNIDVSKLDLKTLKQEFLRKSSWHHTSCKYNVTDFYTIRDDINEWTQDNITMILKHIDEDNKKNQLKQENLQLAEELRNNGKIIVYGIEIIYISDFWKGDHEIMIDGKAYTWNPNFNDIHHLIKGRYKWLQ